MAEQSPRVIRTVAPDLQLSSEPIRTKMDWPDVGPKPHLDLLRPVLERILGSGQGQSLIDLGCGNGALTASLTPRGFDLVGIESAEGGIRTAQATHPTLDFRAHDLSIRLPVDLRRRFDIALAVDVIEHLVRPRDLFDRADEALAPDGRLIVATPFRGYWKNLAMAVSGRFENQWNPTQDDVPLRLFSEGTLRAVATDCGYETVSSHRVGRPSALAKLLIVEFHRTHRPTLTDSSGAEIR